MGYGDRLLTLLTLPSFSARNAGMWTIRLPQFVHGLCHLRIIGVGSPSASAEAC